MKSMLVTYPPIGGHSIQCDDERRVLVVDHERLIMFSPIQYRLLKLLLNHSDGSEPVPVADGDLVRAVFFCEMSVSMRVNLDKHFDNIRSKLRPYGLNVRRVVNYGYFLVAVSS